MMDIRKIVSRLPVVRPLAIGLLRLTKMDIRVRNPWTGDKLFLNSFHHKSYWFFGRVRENATMRMLEKSITRSDTVIEVGGHIGFISQFLSRMVGSSGRVIVFEPGGNNLPYIRENLKNLSNLTLAEMAVSDRCGTVQFYEDNVTGQNNSLLPDYENAESVAKSHGLRLRRNVAMVPVTTLDAYVEIHKINPNFIKMDIEGAELGALLGASLTLAGVRGLMVEVTKDHDAIMKLLKDEGFRLFNDNGGEIFRIDFSGNVFAFKTEIRVDGSGDQQVDSVPLP